VGVFGFSEPKFTLHIPAENVCLIIFILVSPIILCQNNEAAFSLYVMHISHNTTASPVGLFLSDIIVNNKPFSRLFYFFVYTTIREYRVV